MRKKVVRERDKPAVGRVGPTRWSRHEYELFDQFYEGTRRC